MKDYLRSLLGIRKKRKALSSNKSPEIGSMLLMNDIKMMVNTKIDQALWDWLLLSGWRVNTYPNDRRSYASMPANALTQLALASVEAREVLYIKLLAEVKPAQPSAKK